MDELTIENLPATTRAANPFIEAASNLGLHSLPFLKFTKGEWFSGADTRRIGDELFAVDVAGAEHGYVCFREGSVPAVEMVPVASGRKVLREDLPDLGNFPDGNGWKEAASLRLVLLSTAEEFTYCPTSQGGRGAIAKLLRQYGLRLEAGRPAVPIVELRTYSQNYKRYGDVQKPDLHVVEWREGTAAASAGEDLRDDDDCPW